MYAEEFDSVWLTARVHMFVCVFRLVHLEGWGHDRAVKQDKLPGCIMHNKASLSPFPRGARRLYNPLNITCWKGSFTSSPWSNHKISITNYPLALPLHHWPTGCEGDAATVLILPSLLCKVAHWRLKSGVVSKDATLHLEVPGLCPHISKHLHLSSQSILEPDAMFLQVL